MSKLQTLFAVCFVLQCCLAQQKFYKAAVVEYLAKITPDTPTKILLNNVQEYVNYIQQAAETKAQIIVFPEYGLTGWKEVTEDTIDADSTELPSVEEKITPCNNQFPGYSMTLVYLSCAAKTHKIYVVANLIEKVHDNATSKTEYYNTNIVLDRHGLIIAKYRKINLYNEKLFQAGDENQISTFKTDFGVTFGMFICFDIAFQYPAINILSDPEVTDIVYSTAWLSVLPFYGSLSTQHGYAISNGVNLLAAGLNLPEESNGGSGIYLADGRIAESYISGVKKSRMITHEVPIISSRPSPACQKSQIFRGHYTAGYAYIESFLTLNADLSNYTFVSLNLSAGEISENVCSSKFCCTFDVKVHKYMPSPNNYEYKLVAFHGAERVSETKTVGVSNCALVACLNESIASCGIRNDMSSQVITFESISIKGSFPSADVSVQPTTLNIDLKPIIDYEYCETDLNGRLEANISTTERQSAILTFGIFGRTFGDDDKPEGLIETNSGSFNFVNLYILIVSFWLIIRNCSK